MTKSLRILPCQRRTRVNLSFQMGDGSALNAKTIISREERNVTDVRSQEQSRTWVVSLCICSSLIIKSSRRQAWNCREVNYSRKMESSRILRSTLIYLIKLLSKLKLKSTPGIVGKAPSCFPIMWRRPKFRNLCWMRQTKMQVIGFARDAATTTFHSATTATNAIQLKKRALKWC